MLGNKVLPFLFARDTAAKSVRLAHCAAALVFTAAAAFAQSTPSVPPQYQGLYSAIESKLTSFTNQLGRQGASPSPVLNSGQLRSASSDEGGLLLAPGRGNTVETEMLELKALGVGAVTIHVDFPILYAPFYTNANELQQYESFYSQVASQARAAGLKLIVESQLMKFSTSQIAYVQGLSWSAYQAGRAQNAVMIAKLMKPDYLVAITEPDTEQLYSAQPSVGTISGSTQMLQTILQALSQAGLSGIPVGAGVGSWMPSFDSWMNAYAAMPIQFLDLHVYPINLNYLQNTLTAASIAQHAGKEITLSEAWLQKVSNAELSQPVANTNTRNPYGYWAPLDLQFLQAMAMLSQTQHFTFMSPFWTPYLFAYIQETSTSTQQDAFKAAETANALGLFTSTGSGYENLILSAPDTTPPQVPGPGALMDVAGTVHLTWQPSADNIGTAGYHIYRNGTLIGSSSTVEFDDAKLSPGVYIYATSAYDASGNSSPLSRPEQIAKK